MKAMSSGYETIAEKIIGCFSNNYALAHFEPGVSLKHIPWWGAMTLHYFHHFGFKYFEVVLHDARCIPVFYEARKLNVRQTLQKWCYFKKVVCAKKCYWEEKLEGCVILTSLSQTWIHEIAWSFVHGHQLHFVLNCVFLLQAAYSSSKSMLFYHTTVCGCRLPACSTFVQPPII